MAPSKCISITSIRSLKSTTGPCSPRWPYRRMIVRASPTGIKSPDSRGLRNDHNRARFAPDSPCAAAVLPTPLPAPARPLGASGSQVAPALLLQFHEPDRTGFDDSRLRDERDIFGLNSHHILAGVPTCRKGKLWHGFAHGLDARFDGRGVVSQHVQSGSKRDHFDLNLLAEIAVILSHIAHVIEGKIHNGGIVDVDLHNQPMRLLLLGRAADFGRRTAFGRNAD